MILLIMGTDQGYVYWSKPIFYLVKEDNRTNIMTKGGVSISHMDSNAPS
jgi:hypothetical protein